MLEPREPRYEWGQKVAAETDLFNDGSHPDVKDGALLVQAGTAGEIVQVGFHPEANLPIYLVEFASEPSRVVGVLEEEIRVS